MVKKNIDKWYSEGSLSDWEKSQLDEVWCYIDSEEFELEDVKKILQCIQVAKRKANSLPAEFPNGRNKLINRVDFISPWWNNNCAIVVGSKNNDRYEYEDNSIWVMSYYPHEDNLQAVRIPGEFDSLGGAIKVNRVLPRELNENNPIFAITNSNVQATIAGYQDWKKFPASITDPKSYGIKPLDVIEVVNENYLVPYSHTAIYLGKDSRTGKHKVAQVTKSPNNRALIHKRPELIKEQIARAVSSSNYVGAYEIFTKSDDLTKGNCQNFVSRCILGINSSPQADMHKFQFSSTLVREELDSRPLKGEVQKIDNHFSGLNMESQDLLNNNRRLINEYTTQIVYDTSGWQHRWSGSVMMKPYSDCKLQ